MTPGTSKRQSHKYFARGISAIDDIFSLELFFHDTSLHILRMIAIKGCSDDHLFGWVRHQIPRQLLLNKLIIWQIIIVSLDDPIPVRSHISQSIDRIPM